MISDEITNESQTIQYVNEENENNETPTPPRINNDRSRSPNANIIEERSNNDLEACENGQIPNHATHTGRVDTFPENKKKNNGYHLPTRYVLVIMGFFAFVNVYMMYLNLTAAWPAMVIHNNTLNGAFWENIKADNSNSQREKREKNNEVIKSQEKKQKIKLKQKIKPPKDFLSPPESLQINNNMKDVQTSSIIVDRTSTSNMQPNIKTIPFSSENLTTVPPSIFSSSLGSDLVQLAKIKTDSSPAIIAPETGTSNIVASRKIEETSTVTTSIAISPQEKVTILPISSSYSHDKPTTESKNKKKRKKRKKRRRRNAPKVTHLEIIQPSESIVNIDGDTKSQNFHSTIPPLAIFEMTEITTVIPSVETSSGEPLATETPANLLVTILVDNKGIEPHTESPMILETDSPLFETPLEDLVNLSSVTINSSGFSKDEVDSLIETTTVLNEKILTTVKSSEDVTEIPESEWLSEAISTTPTILNTEITNTEMTSTTFQPTTSPLSVPEFLNSYDFVDEKGTVENGTINKNWTVPEHHLVTPNESNRVLFNFFQVGLDQGKSKGGPRLLFKLSDHFKLKNCSKITNASESKFDSDIKCLSSLGIISFTFVGEDDSSSSSSSSSEEDSDEEEEDSEEEDDDEDEDDDEEEEEEEEEEGEGENEDYEGEEEENTGDDEEEENVREKFINYSKGFINVKNKMEINENHEKFSSTPANCEDSSEECGEGEEEEEEEEEETEDEQKEDSEKKEGEEEEDEENGKKGTGAKGLIKLDEKFPSHVCFYKEKVGEIKFEGYDDGEFNWKPQVHNDLNRAYYWGFLVSQIPSARLTSIIGGKITLLLAVLFAAFTTLLTPYLAHAGISWLITGRVFLGMMQGMCMPAFHAILAKWAPPLERTRMVAYVYSGIAVGAVLGGPLSAFLVQRIGWRALFYSQGGIALVWSILWFLLISETPNNHPRISEKEKQHIVSSVGQHHYGVPVVRWCSILKSKHVLGLSLAHGSFLWAWHTLLHYAPRYIATFLHDSLPNVQKVWAAALGCMFVTTCAYGTIADWLIKSKKASVIVMRRTANSICSLLPAIFLVGVAQSGCRTEVVKVCFALAIAMGIPGGIVGLFTNAIDLAPSYAAAIIAVSGTFATSANILSPYYWLLTVSDQPTLERWRTIWYTSAIFLLLANCLFFLLVGRKVDEWNRPLALNKTNKRDEENGIGRYRRRRMLTHGIKNTAYVSTERL